MVTLEPSVVFAVLTATFSRQASGRLMHPASVRMSHGLLLLAIPVVERAKAKRSAVEHLAKEGTSICCEVLLIAPIRVASRGAAPEEKAAIST